MNTDRANKKVHSGDAVFFHSNLLHTSSQNNGPDRRWALAIAYNRADNNPVMEHHHPQYTKLDKVPNSAILDCDVAWDVAAKNFMTTEAPRPDLQDVVKSTA
nr:hypothetical protein BaRGS_002372 [Batillaria attramentaria]